MLILILNEDNLTKSFYPLTLTRGIIDLKAGIFSIKEKWERIAKNQNIELTIASKNAIRALTDEIKMEPQVKF